MTISNIQIMGILNITPDSFSDGGEYLSLEKAIKRAKQMIAEGADIIDIGGESTRPGSESVSVTEELSRVIPVITAIKKHFPNIPLSIDTWKAEVAKQALANGCSLVNSLGGFTFDPHLARVIAQHNCKIIMYHIKGKPKTMQKHLLDAADIMQEISDFFMHQISFGESHGIAKDRCILDPGIGFGKTVEQNITIIKRLSDFQQFQLPVAVGISRKSHLGMILKDELGLETNPTERLSATLAETAIAIQKGATIIRTHDVLETNKFIKVFEKLL